MIAPANPRGHVHDPVAAEAYAAALTHRLATFYLPPIWGWFSLRYLTRIALTGTHRFPGDGARQDADHY